jgi:hypothetical protein
MAHYAKIENNTVTNVIVADQQFINSGIVGDPATWIEITNDDGLNIHYAGIGFTYDNVLNIFIPPKPFDSWVLDGVNWVAPTPRPLDDKTYAWSEETLTWVEINLVLPEIK